MGKSGFVGWFLGSLLLLGCGSDDGDDAGASGGFPASATCGMSIAVSGAWDETIAKTAPIACATTLSSGAGIDATFITTEGELLESVSLRVDQIGKDETGGGFPTELELRHGDQRRWTASDCTADVLTHAYADSDELFDYHRIAGTAACPTPATADDPTSPALTITSFAFVCRVPWTR